MIAMSRHRNLTADSIRDAGESAEVTVVSTVPNVREKTVRGQYTSGFAQGKVLVIWKKGREQVSNTETFMAIRVDIDDWRWAGCRSAYR